MVLAPVRRADRILSMTFLFADLIFVPLAFLTTYWLRAFVFSGFLPVFSSTFEKYVITLPVIIFIWLATFGFNGLYRPRRLWVITSELAHVLKSVVQITIALMAASYLVKEDYSRMMLFMFAFISTPGCLIFRSLARKIALKIAPIEEVPKILVVGSGEVARRIIKSLNKLPGLPPEIAGVIVTGPKIPEDLDLPGISIFVGLDNLKNLIEELNIDEVFFASPELEKSKILSIISEESTGKVHFRIVTDLFDITTAYTDIDNVARLPIIQVGQGGLSLSQRLTKRIVDVLVSIIFIIVMSPLFLVIYLILLLSSEGTPIFKQKRVGFRGKEFTFYKFRTMKPEAGEYEVAPLSSNDPRITPIGRFLRRTSLDEFPQLFNVLTGKMSLVGPRPEMPFIVEKYEAWQKHRLHVKPGLTGLWQIMGRKDLPLHENLEFDFFYIRNQSLMLDFAILLRTFSIIFRKKGAY